MNTTNKFVYHLNELKIIIIIIKLKIFYIYKNVSRNKVDSIIKY